MNKYREERDKLKQRVEMWETRARFTEALVEKLQTSNKRLRIALADHACGSGCTYPDHKGLL